MNRRIMVMKSVAIAGAVFFLSHSTSSSAHAVESVVEAALSSFSDGNIEPASYSACDSRRSCGGCSSVRCKSCCGGLFGPCDRRGRHRACYSHKKRHGLADKHAPAGLMGDHVHKPGDIMVEYKYMNMQMSGNQAGTNDVSQAGAFGFGAPPTNVFAIPLNMTMEMHMFHFMYGWTEDVTLWMMPTITSLTMDHLRNTPFPNGAVAGQRFTTNNTEFDDLAMGALWRVYEGHTDELLFNLAFSVPTGNFDKQTTVPLANGTAVDFPYPMRVGSGTFDFMPAVTYKSYFDHGSVGLQYQADLTVGENDQNYAVGDMHRLNAWYSWLACDRLAFSFRVENLWKNNYDGADPDPVQPFISTNRPDMRGGYWVNAGYGVMWLLGDGFLVNFEAVHPLYEDLEGIQLSNNWWSFASFSKAF